MAPWQPKRALVVGILTALPFTIVATVLFAIGGDWVEYGYLTLLTGTLATGIVTSWFLHAIYAILLTFLISAIAFILVLGIVGGMQGVSGLLLIAPWLFAAAVPGAIIGLFVRPWVRKRVDE